MKKKSSKKRPSWVIRLLYILNGVVIIILLASYLTPYIDPSRFPYLSVLGLSYPLVVFFNVLFIIFWLIRGRWTFVFSLAALLLGINHVFTHLQFHSALSKEPSQEATLSVVSYNVHLFGYFDGKNKQKIREQIFDFLENTPADIYCFQEFFDNENLFPIRKPLQALLNTPYVYTHYFLNGKDSSHYGIAIFSKYPILDSGLISIRPRHPNNTIYADLLWNNDTIRIYNNHLESIRFNKEDYRFYNELTRNPSEQKDMKRGSVSLFRKLVNAYRSRAVQARLVAGHISESQYPVVVCGDFNDTPLSYTYRTISSGLSDAFVQQGRGLGKTYAGLFPSYRIDYLLFSPTFNASQYTTVRRAYSDHYPVHTTLIKSKTPQTH